MDKNLTTKEAAAYLHVSTKTMERWRKERRSPPYYRNGGVIRYPLNSLKEWQDGHMRT